MAFISSIDVVLWNAASIGTVLPLLHSAGWRFWNNEIQWCCFTEVGDEKLTQISSSEQWQSLVVDWDLQCAEEKTLQILYQWRDQPEQMVTVWFSRTDELNDSLLKVQFIMYPAWQRLCGSTTDFSWYLERIVCPLENGDCGVLEVLCSDDNT